MFVDGDNRGDSLCDLSRGGSRGSSHGDTHGGSHDFSHGDSLSGNDAVPLVIRPMSTLTLLVTISSSRRGATALGALH